MQVGRDGIKTQYAACKSSIFMNTPMNGILAGSFGSAHSKGPAIRDCLAVKCGDSGAVDGNCGADCMVMVAPQCNRPPYVHIAFTNEKAMHAKAVRRQRGRICQPWPKD